MQLSKSDAKDLVEKIAKDHGHLGEEVYSRMDPDTRRKVESALLKKDEIIGSSIITLAKNLYSKDVRFIFELLQNADDNHFKNATADGEVPCVTFRISDKQIVVECNEDGFTEENLRAICNVGKSSKMGAQGYIGEKGIGFKSVFKVASKVHIQSGPFSFCFKHRPGDSGMGMISPEWQDETDRRLGPVTRMTFTLHDDADGDPAIRAAQLKSVADQFKDLQPAMLLFLKQLRRIEIRFCGSFGEEVSASVMSMSQDDADSHRAILETVRTAVKDTVRNEVERARQHYHVTKEMADGLAPNENREYTEAERAEMAYSRAEVVLAFPLSDASVPVIEQQELFAFLPIRKAGFNFLIHSDFVTMANREDIVTSSLRNRSLRKPIALAFISALKQMCEHSELRFQWMRYLPKLGNYPWDPFWKVFVDLLKEQLGATDIMIPRASNQLQPIGRLKRIPADALDQDRNPLFDDLVGRDAMYLSVGYRAQDLNDLTDYGLKYMDIMQVIDRVRADLERPSSKMKSAETDRNWHTRVAKVLCTPFEKNWASTTPNVKALPLFPLTNGCWVSPASGPVHFPVTDGGLVVPPGLGLQLIDSKAAAHPYRTRLFICLGAMSLSSMTVRALILQKYAGGYLLDVSTSAEFLRFLYGTEPEGARELPDTLYSKIALHDSASIVCNPSLEDLFFSDSSKPHLPATLGLEVKFLHPDYLLDPPRKDYKGTMSTSRDWECWLGNRIGIRREIRLVSRQGGAFSDEFQFVARTRPHQLLGLLKSLWPSQGFMFSLREEKVLAPRMKQYLVSCEGAQRLRLSETILPTPRLKQLYSRFMEDREPLPFLRLESTLVEEQVEDWEFLASFGVILGDDLSFYLAMIKSIVASSQTKLQRPTRVLEIYAAIHEKCTQSTNRPQDEALVRDTFEEVNGIYIPANWPARISPWCSINDRCLLNAPPYMKSKYPIDHIYKEAFESADMDWETISRFFQVTLAAPKCSWRDLVEELRYLKRETCTDVDAIQQQYRLLSSERLSKDDRLEMKQLFEENALVFVSTKLKRQQGSWHKASDCLWSTATVIRGKKTLAKLYGNALEKFFTDMLGVEKLSAKMVIQEMMKLTLLSTVEEVKKLLWSLNSLLESGNPQESLQREKLLKKSILPVRSPKGVVEPGSAGVEFGIPDRKELEEKFRNKISMLDFTLGDVRKLKPFLRWAGLEDRYLSHMVRETPVLGEGDKFQVSDQRFDIRRKAHGFLRLAAHYRSPRFEADGQALYDLLRASETWETDGISSKLSIFIGGATFTVELEQSDVFIDEASVPIKIYIPHDDGAQDVCIQKSLPDKLVEWMMKDTSNGEAPRTVDADAVGIVTGLLNARVASIGKILDKNGIADIADIRNLDPHDIVGGPSAPAPATPPELANRVQAGQETPVTDYLALASPSSFQARGVSFRNASFSQGHVDTQTRNAEYCKLLNHIIDTAGGIRFPRWSGDISPLRGHISVDLHAAVHIMAASRSDRQMKLDAAGELFVFHFLSSLTPTLPGFSREDWKSKRKALVKVHQTYAAMTPWTGAETSDLEYDDIAGILTARLIENGYLSQGWQDRRPKYYIDVKSTSERWDSSFSMGGARYQKMRDFSNSDSVYIIARVFEMYTGAIDVKFYVNPLELYRQGLIDFSAAEYTVKPLY
ncbi:hypothetical protein B0H67DRAFT_558107 [Lasiosphaeris hirsuta]|uniref:Protein NO VEIN C-terminal domain-containing protein n=1 Tax=Lasiosphaeris hirsuta TaxID=260670 RepID=A0AA39ZXM1_9PEZI|nr:hypothetical protein B0H67DRAFT_558107 [Lasiosphaeris hirsuta]